MVAPTSNPPINSISLSGPKNILGEVTDLFQPVKLESWSVVIPSPLIGNEPIAGYAAFTTDGITANRGDISSSLNNFLGFFENQYFNEWNVGSLTGSTTLGDKFKTTVCQQGTICVYNCSPIFYYRYPLYVVTSITPGTTPAEIVVGALYQGSTPTGATTLLLTNVEVIQGSDTTGTGILVNVLST